MSTSSSTSERRARGAAMVEMAILLTLLVALFLGITEIGRAVMFQHRLTKAVEAAARYLGRSWNAVNVTTCAPGAQWSTATAFAANLATRGDAAGTGTPLLTGFDTTSLTFSSVQRAVAGVGNVCVVHVEAKVAYVGIFGSDLLPVLGISEPALNAASEERYVGD